LYGLKQAQRAWYGRLRGFLFRKRFEMGKVDKTLFLLRQGDDILIFRFMWMILSGIHPGYRKEGSRQTPSRIPLYYH
jgi:hypothetical protein